MNATQSPGHCNGSAIGQRIRLLFCLLVMIAIVLSLGQADAVQANNAAPAYVAFAADSDADCAGGHPLSGTHCCAGVACAEYAQHEAIAVSILADDEHFPPATQSNCIGRTPRPAPQPPRA